MVAVNGPVGLVATAFVPSLVLLVGMGSGNFSSSRLFCIDKVSDTPGKAHHDCPHTLYETDGHNHGIPLKIASRVDHTFYICSPYQCLKWLGVVEGPVCTPRRTYEAPVGN